MGEGETRRTARKDGEWVDAEAVPCAGVRGVAGDNVGEICGSGAVSNGTVKEARARTCYVPSLVLQEPMKTQPNCCGTGEATAPRTALRRARQDKCAARIV